MPLRSDWLMLWRRGIPSGNQIWHMYITIYRCFFLFNPPFIHVFPDFLVKTLVLGQWRVSRSGQRIRSHGSLSVCKLSNSNWILHCDDQFHFQCGNWNSIYQPYTRNWMNLYRISMHHRIIAHRKQVATTYSYKLLVSHFQFQPEFGLYGCCFKSCFGFVSHSFPVVESHLFVPVIFFFASQNRMRFGAAATPDT